MSLRWNTQLIPATSRGYLRSGLGSYCSRVFWVAHIRNPNRLLFPQLVGGQFDLEMNFIIQEVESVDCMVELLDRCEPTCQAEVWSIFSAILKKSIRNLQACTETGLIEQVLSRIDKTDCMIAGTYGPCANVLNSVWC